MKEDKTRKKKETDVQPRAKASGRRAAARGEAATNKAVRLAAELSMCRTELEMQNEELRSSHQIIERGREELATLYDYAPVAYFTFDPEGVIKKLNLTAATLLGADRTFLIEKPFGAYVAGGYAQAFVTHVAAAVNSDTKQCCELVLSTRHSKAVVVSAQSIAVRDDSGESRILSVITDITDRRGLDEERQRLEEQLRQSHKMEAVGTLAGGMAHRFNNMLTVIIGNAELALDELPGGGEEAPHYIEQVLKESKRARDLVRQILMFSRKDGWERKPVRLTGVVKETVRLLQQSLPGAIKISVHIDTVSDTVLANPSQVGQALVNLATNAAHAMREKGGNLDLRLSQITLTEGETPPDGAMRPGAYARVSVQDTGAGMPRDVQRRIFEPFFTTREPSGSTGMGLAVVYGIVKSHGGGVSVESKVGHGSTFTLFFPLHLPQVQ